MKKQHNSLKVILYGKIKSKRYKMILKQRPIYGLLHLIYVKHKKAGRKDVRPVDKSAGYGRTDR